MNGFRSVLYRLARLLGDVSAVKNGTVGRRIVRKAAYRGAARTIERVLR